MVGVAGVIVNDTADEVLPAFKVSPLYTAVIECGEATVNRLASGVRVAVPLLNSAEPSDVPPS